MANSNSDGLTAWIEPTVEVLDVRETESGWWGFADAGGADSSDTPS